jgi:hypothetical protein
MLKYKQIVLLVDKTKKKIIKLQLYNNTKKKKIFYNKNK